MVGNCPHSVLTRRHPVSKILTPHVSKSKHIAWESNPDYTRVISAVFLASPPFLCWQIWQISQQIRAICLTAACLVEEHRRRMSYQMSAVKDLSEEEATEMICEMVDEREGGVGKKEDIRASIIAGQLGKHQTSSSSI